MLNKVHLQSSEPPARRLLIIEDNPADIAHYMRLLEEIEFHFDCIESVQCLSDGREAYLKNPPDCCLLDNYLPDGSAQDFLEQISIEKVLTLFPIIVITGQEDAATAVNLMHIGAQDYLVKQQLDAPQLERAMLNAMKTWTLRSQLNHLALYDSLTGLANRALFMDRISQLFAESQRYSRSFALMYLDLDNFKYINDTFGHEAGDAGLKAVSERLLSTLRRTDTAARLGGDEFAILLPDIAEAKAHHVAYKLVQALSFDIKWGNGYIAITPSIGLATWPSKAQSCNDMMREADMALYRAKDAGRAQYSAFTKRYEEQTRKSEMLASALPRALLDTKLQIAWQPIIGVNDHTVSCVEALVRWNHKNGWVPPPRIIELVLERRLGDLFHEWLFNQAMGQLTSWQAKNKALKVALNLPANLCHDKKIIQSLLNAMKTYAISPENVVVEITETHLMRHPDDTRKQLVMLADIGIEISIDDFGTGYSSMQYLASLPCNTLKIDQSFFLTLSKNPRNHQIIEAITALAHRLDLKVVAEGIETAELLQAAKHVGCDFAQGYWLGAPVISQNPFPEFCDESKAQGDQLTGKP